MTCPHLSVDLAISYPRELTAWVLPTGVCIHRIADTFGLFGVGPGRLKLHCRDCGHENYWPTNRPDTWPKWARSRVMAVARCQLELLELLRGLPPERWALLEHLP